MASFDPCLSNSRAIRFFWISTVPIGESYGTVRRYRWVAKAYQSTSACGIRGLSFSHFQAVAGLPDLLVVASARVAQQLDRLRRESRTGTAAAKPARARTKDLAALRSSIEGRGDRSPRRLRSATR